MIELRGITWNHTRGFVPMVATAQRFGELHPEVTIRWEKRSLQEFADAPVEQLAERFDLLVIDHPSVGACAAAGTLLPLDEHLPAEFLAGQAANSVGRSHASYFYEGHQWALATDAATPVAGYRRDLLAAPPRTWDELMRLAYRGMVAISGIPIDTLCHFWMMCLALGEEPFAGGRVISQETGVRALAMLGDLMRAAVAGCEKRNPIGVWELLTSTDAAAYCPFAYGYSNYGRRWYAARPLAYAPLVEIEGRRCRSTLGGAGLAIAAKCAHRAEALAYAQFVAGAECQRGLYFESGGQPGHRAAWTDEGVNEACNGFFRDTLATLDEAWVRPRWAGFIEFQEAAALVVHRCIWTGGDARTAVAELNRFAAEKRGVRHRATRAVRPLEGMLVLDFSQFLAGPSAALRLADLGARVIKIERPGAGDLCRRLYISNLELEGDSTLFHSINRNKEGFAADLKNPEDRRRVVELIRRADVMIQNFRPGVMQRLALDYESLKDACPRLVYAEVTGYGGTGPWRHRPGQDLLVQSLSGLAFLNGNADQPPMPFGLAVADLFAGAHLVQGVLACLVRRGLTGRGGHVEVSLMESVLDLQFEVLTTYLNDGGKAPARSGINNAHAYLGAPYGIYATKDGYLALAMGSVTELGRILGCDELLVYEDPQTWFTARDEIKRVLAEHLRMQTTAEWLARLEPAGYWASDVLSWAELMKSDAFGALDMVQEVPCRGGHVLRTTRCPIRMDGEVYKSARPAPAIGQDTAQILRELER